MADREHSRRQLCLQFIEHLSRKEARARGLARYYDGRVCPNGHRSERYVHNGACTTCEKERHRKWRWKAAKEGYFKVKRSMYPERYKASERRWRAKNPEYGKDPASRARRNAACRAAYKTNFWKNAAKMRAKAMAKHARKLHCMPLWADKADILHIYEEAVALEIDTGIAHNVDHIVPLNHVLVCGLHVPWNLRAVPAWRNNQKRNHFLDDETLGLILGAY